MGTNAFPSVGTLVVVGGVALLVVALLIAGLVWLAIVLMRPRATIATGSTDAPLGAGSMPAPTGRVVVPPSAPLEGAEEEEVTEETLQVGSDRPFLKPVSPAPGFKGPFYLSPTGVTYIGRSADNTIVLADQTASSKHCKIAREGAYYVLTDLGSSNKVFVNGAQKERVVLRNGDQIKIGSTTLIFALFGDRA